MRSDPIPAPPVVFPLPRRYCCWSRRTSMGVADGDRPVFQRLFRTKSLDALRAEAGHDGHGLRRILGPGHLILLGIGAIVGAGIFALVGTAAAGDPTDCCRPRWGGCIPSSRRPTWRPSSPASSWPRGRRWRASRRWPTCAASARSRRSSWCAWAFSCCATASPIARGPSAAPGRRWCRSSGPARASS